MLNQLLEPISREEFFARYFERAPLHIRRSLPDWMRALVAVSDVDELIALSAVTPADVRIVKTVGATVQHVPVPAEGDGRPELAGVCSAYATGHTIIVN